MDVFPNYDTLADWLEEEVQEIPLDFLEGLNLGIVLSEEKREAEESAGDLFVLGEYITDMIGAQIILYYGSFKELFLKESEEVLRAELRETLHHELVHHLEERAGVHDLDDEDERELLAYLTSCREDENHAY